MWFEQEPVDADWAERQAPHAFDNVIELDAPPEVVFDLLVGPDAWPEFFPDMVRVEYTSQPPHGVGSTRTVELTTQTVHEEFLVFERGERWTFFLTGASLPLTRSFAEDYRFEPLEGGRTRLHWRAAFAPRWWFRPLRPLLQPVFRRQFEQGARNLVEYVREHRDELAS